MYKPEDFRRCLFNPLEKQLLKTYPELDEIHTDEKLLRYIIALYDPVSPLVRLYLDIRLRKQEAARLAGYNLIENGELLESLYSFKDEAFRTSTIAFLRKYCFPREWFMICANEQTLYEYGERMLKPIDETDSKEKDIISAIAVKSKLSADMEEINERIEKGYKKLFSDDEALIPKVKRTTAESQATKV